MVNQINLLPKPILRSLLTQLIHLTRVSSVTSRSQFTKRNKRKAESEMKDWFNCEFKKKVKLKVRWRRTKWRLTCCKVKNYLKKNKLKAKHHIDNIMFRFHLQQDENSHLPPNHQTQNWCASEFIRSPPPTPRTPVEASSPVYGINQQILFCQISVPSKICSPKVISSIVIKILLI